jgi:uncharacterized repeat protein (TIGR01451 family)
MHSRLLAVLALTSLLSACGGGGGGGGSEQRPAASGDRVSLTVSASNAPVPSVANTDLDFVVANPGTVTASNVALTVTLGPGLTRAGVQCVATNATCPSDPNTSMEVVGLPPGGSLHFKMSVIPEAGASGTITSTASVSATNDEVTSNNTAQVGLTVYSAEVSVIGSTTSAELFSGSAVTYSLTVSNAGPDAARNVQLENTLSSGQSMTAMTCTASGGATCPTTGATMTIPTLPGGGSLTFSITALLSMQAIISVSDTLRITSLGDANFGNNTATASVATRIPTSPDSPSFMVLRSDVGDYVGGGGSYSYTNENAVFEVFEASAGLLSLKVMGDEDWSGFFYMPQGMAQIQKGTYTDLIGAPFHDPATGGFYLSGGSRTCGPHSDWFKVDDVVYAAGQLASIDIRFEQHCGGSAPALRGQLHWNANDATRPPGPVNPPPAGLWQPAPGSTPSSGNYVYIVSDPLDFIGEGRTETYTPLNSILTVRSEATGELGVGINGDRQYGATFKAMVPLTRVEPGYYPEVQRWPFGNPARGMMAFGGDGRGCNVLSGWFIIDTITYSGADVTALDARFEQHCENRTAALRGKIHWRSDDPTQPAGPQVPPPAGLWTPPAGSVPATGNVIYLQSDANDFIGQGISKAYTPLDSVIEVGGGGMTPVGNRFQLTVRGDEEWTGFFQAMSTLSDLQPGYYGNLQAFPGNNPVYGGISWSGEGRGCNTATGWFVIDSVTYSGSTLDSIELRFEQHCEGFTPALHGLVRWSAADTRTPLPPQVPPPPNLWAPPSGATPASGNYAYFESEAGDFVGQGQTHLYTTQDAVFVMTTTGSQLNVEVQGDERWGGYFIPMVPLAQLQVGYYGNLASANPAKGSLNWHSDGRGCGNPTGWFVVDDVSYASGSLTSIDVRFEQHCDGSPAALHGKIHWRFDDPTQAPGPQNPPPAGLWAPAPGANPATGNVFYLESEPGDYIGQGQTRLYTSSNATFESATLVREFIVGVHSAGTSWSGHFDHMSSIPRLQPGYYPDVQGLVLHNPARGGMDVSGESRACNTLSGWFVIDSVTYTGTTVTAIDLRFEQHCENAAPALHGRIRWSQ